MFANRGFAKSVLALLVGLVFAPPACGGQVIGQLTDPPDPACEGFVDILSAWIEQDGGLLTFTIETRTSIPTSVSGPDEHITYLWLIDADNDPETGQPHEQVGSEFNVRVVISELFGGGFVDVTGALPGGGPGTVSLQDNRVQITIGLGQIAGPTEFRWATDAFHAVDNVCVSANYETDPAVANALPYTALAHVTVVTPLLMLSPSGPTEGQLEVEVRDAAGNLLPTSDYHLTFRSSNDAVASVNADGLVTAHAVPVQFDDTPVVEVWADGIAADNVAIIRVTDTDLGVVHDTFAGSHVAFYLPSSIEGVNLEAITTDYEVVPLTDAAYAAQEELMGVTPFRGGRHYFVLDVADDPVTVPCGISGNPVRLGWEFGKPIHNSCFIVNVPEHRVPQWFVYFHEMGHNFTWASWSFGQFCLAGDTNGWKYSEALASMAGAWSWYRLNRCGVGLDATAVESVAEHFPNIDPQRRQALIEYQSAGANYDEVTIEVICDILWDMYDDYGPKVWFELFSALGPADQPLPLTLEGDVAQATWVVAAVSASAGEDLRTRFADDYGFPIDEARWAEMLSAAQQRIDARPWLPPMPGDADCDLDVDLDDFSWFVGCAAGPGGGLQEAMCDCFDFDREGDVDLLDAAQFQTNFTGLEDD